MSPGNTTPARVAPGLQLKTAKSNSFKPVEVDPMRAVVVMFGVGDGRHGTLALQTGQSIVGKVPLGWQVIETGWSLLPGTNPVNKHFFMITAHNRLAISWRVNQDPIL